MPDPRPISTIVEELLAETGDWGRTDSVVDRFCAVSRSAFGGPD